MNDVRMREGFWNGLSGVALLILAFIALFDLLAPKPKDKLSATAHLLDEGRTTALAAADKKALEKTESENAKYMWTLPVDKIGPTALSSVTAIAKVHNVNLVAFRPQKPTDQNGLLLMPYLIVMEGTYPGVTGLLHDLETTSQKLAVNLVQLAAADQSTDRVNASIGVIAYTKQTTAGSGTVAPAKNKTNAKA